MVKRKVFGETSREKFKRLAADRTNKVIEKIRILGHCANQSQYEYDENDIKKIFSAVDKELRHVKAKFQKPQKTKLRF